MWLTEIIFLFDHFSFFHNFTRASTSLIKCRLKSQQLVNYEMFLALCPVFNAIISFWHIATHEKNILKFLSQKKEGKTNFESFSYNFFCILAGKFFSFVHSESVFGLLQKIWKKNFFLPFFHSFFSCSSLNIILLALRSGSKSGKRWDWIRWTFWSIRKMKIFEIFFHEWKRFERGKDNRIDALEFNSKVNLFN